MGQEIDSVAFEAQDFEEFTKRLRHETSLLTTWAAQGALSTRGPIAGFELEACLTDFEYAPAPVNGRFIQAMNDPLAAPELARFNVEFNSQPRALTARALRDMHRELEATWARGAAVAAACDTRLLSIGILPTLTRDDLTMDALTPLNRYRALNEQVMRSRAGRSLRLDVRGHQRLAMKHDNMMLEAAGTSFQLHLQAPFDGIHRLYNAALAASAPILAAGANSPYLFGVDLWDESRMPLFERSLEVAGFEGRLPAPLPRVSLGSGYARASILECFEENVQHFPVLLPMLFGSAPEMLNHLRLHNGTVWRWVRPLLGFDPDGTPHVRIEQRALPASPSLIDAIGDAALFYGLMAGLGHPDIELELRLPFAQVKDNFQQAARYGLSASVSWLDGKKTGIQALLLEQLLPLARESLRRLALEPADCDVYLDAVRQRVEGRQNGASWQRAFIARHGGDMRDLTAAYAERQQTGAPVHGWPL